MGLENVPRCQHLKVNGTQCGSPALRRRRKCYFHEGVRIEQAKVVADQFGQRRFTLPVLEDANAVQIALMKVLEMLGRGQMDHKTAGLMLYGLQTASSNLKHTKFELEKPTDVVIDRKTVDQTCINGPQWFAREFVDEVQEIEQENAALASAGQIPVGDGTDEPREEETQIAKVRADKIRAAKLRADKRKRPERAGGEMAPPWVRELLGHLVPGWSEDMHPDADEARINSEAE